jgi:hypothetical protein
MEAAKPHPSRGLALILEHCARMNAFEQGRPSALSRLQQAIGDELAGLLLTALAGNHAARPSVSF